MTFFGATASTKFVVPADDGISVTWELLVASTASAFALSKAFSSCDWDDEDGVGLPVIISSLESFGFIRLDDGSAVPILWVCNYGKQYVGIFSCCCDYLSVVLVAAGCLVRHDFYGSVPLERRARPALLCGLLTF